jgi:hypothetical protein
VRILTSGQRALLRLPTLKVRVLSTWYLDEGTYRFCDDVMDLTDGVNTFIGANALVPSIEIKSGTDLAAEPITLTIDGNRMVQAGIKDPAYVLRDMLTYLLHQRRVDFEFGFMAPTSETIQLRVPVAATKINNPRLVDPQIEPGSPDPIQPQLIVTLDSLAARYNRATWRTRSHNDQQEIDPTDMFFSFVADAVAKERTLYWGRAASSTSFGSGSGGGTPGSGMPGRFQDNTYLQ